MKPVIRTLGQSMINGMSKILQTIDTYSRKDDLDKKLLEVAKIIGRRLEKRHEYLAMKLKEMFIYETK
uniref:Rx_N domain-containing protein n=1 Tax=Schistosoma mansoni TaxID=6183 RepID=A0A5K4F5M3_SCHMA